MATVERRENEDIESMLRRFRRKVNDENIIGDMKKHEAFVPKSEIRRLAKQEAIRKQQKLVRAEKAKENSNGKRKRYFKKYTPNSKQPTTEQPQQQ